ncbi:uncharacterized protein LOC121256181 [Juglans microcarpa x Juglans regia]|uniref:uncharacterized protein LOC121256181 n=1 Tax=Juglans microcarpa x Juglans regia TaxID=2249226 RepID=UPI001B7DF4CA|nr:uncharacterized protein LOC121256181 [Juglans microcarpa x Juglans regia]
MPRPFSPEAPSFRRDAEISFTYPPFILINSSSPPSFILMKFAPQSDLQALKPVICGETGTFKRNKRGKRRKNKSKQDCFNYGKKYHFARDYTEPNKERSST